MSFNRGGYVVNPNTKLKVSSSNEEEETLFDTRRATLADDYLIEVKPFEWNCYDLKEALAVHNNNNNSNMYMNMSSNDDRNVNRSYDAQIATLSRASLYDDSFMVSIQPSISMKAEFVEDESTGYVKVESEIRSTIGDDDDDDGSIILPVLVRIMMSSLSVFISSRCEHVKFIQVEINNELVERIPVGVLSDPNKLYQGLCKGDSELVEIVDQEGIPLSSVPRDLVHKFNLLHRGIGMVVLKDEPLPDVDSSRVSESYDELVQNKRIPPLYAHRRTASKRIFPSLYDMFVGGVSGAGEDSRLTAHREISEELGLTNMESISDSLFRCTICTSYNRCIVTVFTYLCDSDNENIKWQEEEVSWGDYVTYDVIVKSADLSIQRLQSQGIWTGHWIDSSSVVEDHHQNDELCDDWATWDYVPDGLLVWEAWEKYLRDVKYPCSARVK